jgi:hypothetical protein
MEKNQIKLLTSLAKEIQSQKKSRAQIVDTFISAKILNEKGKFTKHYPNLSRLVSK